MHLLKSLSLCLAIGFATASPMCGKSWDGTDGSCQRTGCLTPKEATTIVTKLESLYSNISVSLAKAILTPNYHEYSYSMERPAPGKLPKTDVVASSRAEFIKEELTIQANGASPPFKTLNVWTACDSITFRWTLQIEDPSTNTTYLYTGIDVLEIEKGNYLIKADYSEYSV